MSDLSGGGGGTGPRFDLPGLDEAAKQIRSLNAELGNLQTTLKGITASQGQLTGGIKAISSSMPGGGGGYNPPSPSGPSSPSSYGPPPPGPSGPSGGGGGGGGSPPSADMNWMQNILGSGFGGNPISAIASTIMAPMTYAFNRVEENREVTRGLSYNLGRVSSMSGTGIEGLLKMLSEKTPIMGTPEAITGAMSQGASQGYFNMNSPRSGAYYTGLRQMQQFTPGVEAPQLAQTLSGTLGNTRAQQTAMMLTGGAMGNFGAGGVPKTLQEWAESTLRWFEAQRPGADRGKAFTKEELASQVFPGSNMSAWFQRTGVSAEMQDYFWQYAMGKVQTGRDSKAVVSVEEIVKGRGGDLGLATRATETANARRDFTLAGTEAFGGGTFYQNYMTREGADRDFTNMMSQMIDKSISKMLGGVLGSLFAQIPTPIAGFMMQMLQKLPTQLSDIMGQMGGSLGNAMGGLAGKAGTALGSMVGGPVGGAIGGVAGNLVGGFLGDPEYSIGDPGGYGPMGGTNTAGMEPSMAKRVQAMMRANPNLQISSGFRDGSTQDRLHRKGVGMVAPMGKSQHGRGLAADLGPSSQYGWIAQNAGRFGLASGKKHGEPWHVGFPGTIPGKNFMTGDPEFHIGDISDLIGGAASAMSPEGWFGGITGVGSNILDTLGGLGSGLLGGIQDLGSNLFQGTMGLLKGDWTALFGEGGPFNVTGMLTSAMGGLFNLMGIPSILNPFALAEGKAGTGATGKDFAGAFGSLLGSGEKGMIKPKLKSSMNWTPTAGSAAAGVGAVGISSGAAGVMSKYGGGLASGSASVAGKEDAILAALRAASAAGFSGDELIAITAIAGRESSWNPQAHRTTQAKSLVSGDRGEWQINYVHDPGLVKAGIIPSNTPAGRASLFDINTNAKAAFSLTGGGKDFGAWRMGPGGWGTGPPLYKASQFVEPVYNIAKQAHLIGDPEYAPAYRQPDGPAAPNVNIQNVINISGSGASSTPANLRRTAEQLAGYTSEEIRKQLARTT